MCELNVHSRDTYLDADMTNATDKVHNIKKLCCSIGLTSKYMQNSIHARKMDIGPFKR